MQIMKVRINIVVNLLIASLHVAMSFLCLTEKIAHVLVQSCDRGKVEPNVIHVLKTSINLKRLLKL